MNLLVLGTQWGDEGKGKIVDLLAKDFDIVARFQGGNNAGHTVVIGDKTYKFHLIPSGALYGDKKCVLGNGMVIDPEVLLQELKFLEDNGYPTDNFYISERAHVIFPYHKLLDHAGEKKTEKIGTTGRGIGPCYSDKISRLGIRIVDLLNRKVLENRLSNNLPLKQKILAAMEENYDISVEELTEQYHQYGKTLQDKIADTGFLINNWLKQGEKLLLEGAQGSYLDIDHGTYPYVTSSNTIAGNAACGLGIAPGKIGKTIGIAKAYTTRVGMGVFPTEDHGATGEKMREQGHEFGTTTGRPRRCGWLDAVLLKQASQFNGIDEFVVTKLDVLSGISTLKICTGYTSQGKKIENLPADLSILEEIEPVYLEIPGWTEDITACRQFSDLPENSRNYISKMEELIETPVRYVSVGPERNQIIFR